MRQRVKHEGQEKRKGKKESLNTGWGLAECTRSRERKIPGIERDWRKGLTII